MIVEKYSDNGGISLQTPKLIVIHAMGEFIRYENNELHATEFLSKIGLSAHSLIAPKHDDEEAINYRLRRDNQNAYHAKGFNRYSLGMEFLLPGSHNYSTFLEGIKEDYLTEEQFQLGVAQVKEWLELHPITKIKRHSDLSPERKVDPGTGFPWQDFLNEIGSF